MSSVAGLAKLEQLQLARSRVLWPLLGMIVALGLVAAASGAHRVARERAALDAREAFLRDQDHNLRESHADDLGLFVYYLALPTEHAPNAWTALSSGLRDVFPFSQHLRVLGLAPQLHTSELSNPLQQATGSLDYAFVVTFLLPLLVIALCHDVASRDEELGTALLLRSHPLHVRHLVALRLVLRGVIVLLTAAVMFAGAAWLAGVPADGRALAWLAVQSVYLMFWIALAWIVAALRRSSGWSAIVLTSAWIALCVLLPASASSIATEQPLQHGVAFTLKQRELLNAGWDKPRQAAVDAYAARHPERRAVSVPEDRFSWLWYYANQELADRAVEQELRAYDASLEQRESHAHQLALWLPPLATQRALNRLAGTDLPARLDYQHSVARYHEQLKQFFYPLVWAEKRVADVSLAALPRHSFRPEPAAPDWSELVGLCAWLAVLLVLGVLWRGPRSSER
jgi:ABC-2 type transport system permease protein